MKNLIFSHLKNLPNFEIKVKSFEGNFVEKLSDQILTDCKTFGNPFYYGDPLKKLTSEEFFDALLFKNHQSLDKERLIDFSKKKKIFLGPSKKSPSSKKPRNFLALRRISQIGLPAKRKLIACIRSPHVNKKSQEHFEHKVSQSLTILSSSTNLEKNRSLLFLKKLTHKKFPGIQIQFKINSSTYINPDFF